MRWIDLGLSFFLLGVWALITLPMVIGWVSTPVTSRFRAFVISSVPGSGLPVNSHLEIFIYYLFLEIRKMLSYILDILCMCSNVRQFGLVLYISKNCYVSPFGI